MWLAGASSDGIDAVSSDPFCIWWYAHKHRFCDQLVNQHENARLRRYGYVMWDLHPERCFSKSRLREAQRKATADEAALEAGREAMEHSWCERTAIFLAGGRGYWRHIESRVLWPEGGNEKDQRVRMEETGDSHAMCLEKGKPGNSKLGYDAPLVSLPTRNLREDD